MHISPNQIVFSVHLQQKKTSLFAFLRSVEINETIRYSFRTRLIAKSRRFFSPPFLFHQWYQQLGKWRDYATPRRRSRFAVVHSHRARDDARNRESCRPDEPFRVLKSRVRSAQNESFSTGAFEEAISPA